MKRQASCLMVIGVLAALLVGGSAIAVSHLHRQRSLLIRDTQDKQAMLAALDRCSAPPADPGVKLAALGQSVAGVQAQLVPLREMDQVLEQVWRLAEANSLQSRTIKSAIDNRVPLYKEQNVELSLRGDFGGFYQFLLQLEEMKRTMRIKKMNVAKVTDHDGEMQAEISLSIYVEPDAQSL